MVIKSSSQGMTAMQKWQYCMVGPITSTPLDKQGHIRPNSSELTELTIEGASIDRLNGKWWALAGLRMRRTFCILSGPRKKVEPVYQGTGSAPLQRIGIGVDRTEHLAILSTTPFKSHHSMLNFNYQLDFSFFALPANKFGATPGFAE